MEREIKDLNKKLIKMTKEQSNYQKNSKYEWTLVYTKITLALKANIHLKASKSKSFRTKTVATKGLISVTLPQCWKRNQASKTHLNYTNVVVFYAARCYQTQALTQAQSFSHIEHFIAQ